MYYGDTPIADCEWELDDRARKTQKAMAALGMEDHLRTKLIIKHKVLEDDGEVDAETV